MSPQDRPSSGRLLIGRRCAYVFGAAAALLAIAYTLYMTWLVVNDRMPEGMMAKIGRFSGWWSIGGVDLVVGTGFLAMTFGLAWMAHKAWRCGQPEQRQDASNAPLTPRLFFRRLVSIAYLYYCLLAPAILFVTCWFLLENAVYNLEYLLLRFEPTSVFLLHRPGPVPTGERLFYLASIAASLGAWVLTKRLQIPGGRTLFATLLSFLLLPFLRYCMPSTRVFWILGLCSLSVFLAAVFVAYKTGGMTAVPGGVPSLIMLLALPAALTNYRLIDNWQCERAIWLLSMCSCGVIVAKWFPWSGATAPPMKQPDQSG